MLQKIFTMLTKHGLFFKCLPDKTYGFSNEKCHGGNKSKDQLTVMVCCYMTDNDKVELFVIGKIQKSRCFKVFTGPIFRQQKSLDDLGTVSDVASKTRCLF
jgi:hypothetical protein